MHRLHFEVSHGWFKGGYKKALAIGNRKLGKEACNPVQGLIQQNNIRSRRIACLGGGVFLEIANPEPEESEVPESETGGDTNGPPDSGGLSDLDQEYTAVWTNPRGSLVRAHGRTGTSGATEYG